MLKMICSLVLTLLVTSCGGPRYVDFFPCHDDGTAKPAIALVPVKSSAGVSCDISEELTQAIRYQMMDRGELFLLPQESVNASLQRMDQASFFGNDHLFAQHFCNADFVVVTEIISYGYTPGTESTGPRREVLSAKMRVKVIDIREDTPCVVLQEILSVDACVPRNFYQISGVTAEVNEDGYQLSAIARARASLACKFANRVEAAIRSAF